MSDLISYYAGHSDMVFTALKEHVLISLTAVLASLSLFPRGSS